VLAEHPFHELIQEAYEVFEYDTPISTGVCRGCCMDPEIEADFFNPPVRDLPLRYVQDWFFAACDPSSLPRSVWGYLLPRVLEILAAGEDVAAVGLEVSLSRFPTGRQEVWSAREWSVLDRFQRLYLKRYAEYSTEYLDDALCMFGNAGWPLSSLFEQVLGWSDQLIAERLWFDWCQYPPGQIWITAFWEGGGNERAYEFYTSQVLYDRMAALGLAEDAPPEIADKALAVADVVSANAVRNTAS
jgi:hypothetical protein